jgi:molecular chaperone DnaK
LLVGTGKYHNLPGVPAVAQTVHDFAQALVERCGLDPLNLQIVLDPGDPGDVGAALASAAESASETLLFYFVGHGLVSAEGKLFLGTTGVDQSAFRLRWTGVQYDDVRHTLMRSTAQTTVVILDCCFSGRAVETLGPSDAADTAADLASIEGSYVLTAAARDELALAPAGELHTAFTGEVLRYLATGDPAGGAQLTLDDLYRGLVKRLEARGLPRPHRRVNANAADFVLVENAACGTVGGVGDLLPTELVQALADPVPWKRVGALLELEDRLSSTRQEVRTAAQEALLGLAHDADPQVARRATDLWHGRGLGEIPLLEAVPERDEAGTTQLASRRRVPTGIDFGTTNSAVAVFQNGECRVVPNRLGERATPSVATMSPQGTWLVGTPARRQGAANAERTFSSIKLRLGTDWTTQVDGTTFDAEQIASVVLTELKSAAEEYLGADLGVVVLTVPAHFDVAQRYATVQAARRAGLTVERLVHEPTAAALAYGVLPGDGEYVLVVDLGGGTLDVSLLRIETIKAQPHLLGDRDVAVAEVARTDGNNRLGGDDWDHRIVDWLVTRFRYDSGIDLTNDPTAMQRLSDAAESAKIELSSGQQTLITVPYVAVQGDRTPVTLDYMLTRAQFQELTHDLLEQLAQPITRMTQNLEHHGSEVAIDTVVLVGGATRMPAVGDLVAQITGKIPKRDVIPDGVAIGAAIQAAVLMGRERERLLIDATSWSLGVETAGGIVTKLIGRNTMIPTKRSEILTTSEDGQSSVQFRLYEGQRENAAENTLIGVLEFTGIPRAPRGTPNLEVTVDVDANGTIDLSARDLGTGKQTAIKVTGRVPVENAAEAHLPAALPGPSDAPRPASVRPGR